MQNLLLSLPDKLIIRMRASIPARQRSKIIARLIDEEVKKREMLLYQCASAVEEDSLLNKEMEEWKVTLGDGINDGSW